MKMTATGNQMRKEKGAANVTRRDMKEFKGGRNLKVAVKDKTTVN